MIGISTYKVVVAVYQQFIHICYLYALGPGKTPFFKWAEPNSIN